MKAAERDQMFENVVRLRQGERESPGNRQIGPVRTDLERAIGGSVSIAAAARMLGISRTGLSRWVDRGEIPVVLTPQGRRAIPVSSLVDLYEDVRRERDAGRTHALESVVRRNHDRAAQMSAESLLEGDVESEDAHRVPELRSLAYHRAIARRLERPMVDEALRLVRYWRKIGNLDERYAEAWEDVLGQPVPAIRRLLREDSQVARDLRQNSPFAGLLSEAERRKLLRGVK